MFNNETDITMGNRGPQGPFSSQAPLCIQVQWRRFNDYPVARSSCQVMAKWETPV